MFKQTAKQFEIMKHLEKGFGAAIKISQTRYGEEVVDIPTIMFAFADMLSVFGAEANVPLARIQDLLEVLYEGRKNDIR